MHTMPNDLYMEIKYLHSLYGVFLLTRFCQEMSVLHVLGHPLEEA